MKKIFIISVFFISKLIIAQTPQLQYEKSSNCLSNSNDVSVSGAIDKDGNSWNIGYTNRQLTGIDWYIIKLNSDGDTLWTKTYNGPNNGTDKPVGIYIDANGVSYIVGTVETQNNGIDIVVLSLLSNGSYNWQFKYNFDRYGINNNVYNTADEIPIGIKEDSKNQLVIVGYGNPRQNTKDAEVLFFTMDKSNGSLIDEEIIWGGEYYDNGFWIYYEDIPISFDVVNNRVFIASEKRSAKTNYWSLWAIYRYTTGDNWNGILNDMGTMNGGSLGYINYLIYPSGYFYSGKDYNYPTAITGDASGNTYVSGIIDTISNTGVYNKISTIRIPQNQMALSWENKYDNGNGNLKYINDIKIDYGNGMNYITGWVTNSSNNKDILTIKYSNWGVHQWAKTKNWNGNDEGIKLEIDNNDNPIICSNINTGTSNLDIGIIKYNKDNGNETTLLFNKNTEDEKANSIKIDQYNNIYIFGQNKHNTQNINLLNLKYCNYFPIVSVSNNTSICEGTSSQLTSSGGTSYLWSPDYNLSNKNIKNPIASPIITTKYYVQVKENYGCYSTDSITIKVKPKPNKPSLISNSSTCFLGLIDLKANSTTSNVTYEWKGPNNFNSNFKDVLLTGVTFIDSGLYFCRTKLNGCYSDTTSTFFKIKKNPDQPIIESNSPLCVNGNLQLTANYIKGATYYWDGVQGRFNSSEQNPTINNVSTLDSGTYYCRVKVDGCVSSYSPIIVDIGNTPKAILKILKDEGCMGDSLMVSTTIGDFYNWSNGNQGATLQSIKIGNTQNLFCEVTNPNNCIGIAKSPARVLTIHPLPNKPNINIQGENIISTSAISYQWYLNGNLINNVTSQIYKPTVSGKYLVKITDINGCESFSDEIQFYMLEIQDIKKEIKIYPNPTQNTLHIEGISQPIDFEITDMLGKLVLKGKVDNKIDVSALIPGVYVGKIGAYVFKFVKE